MKSIFKSIKLIWLYRYICCIFFDISNNFLFTNDKILARYGSRKSFSKLHSMEVIRPSSYQYHFWSHGLKLYSHRSLVLLLLTDRLTDRQTDGQLEGHADRLREMRRERGGMKLKHEVQNPIIEFICLKRGLRWVQINVGVLTSDWRYKIKTCPLRIRTSIVQTDK